MSIQEKNSGGPVATCIYANPVGKEEEEKKKGAQGKPNVFAIELNGFEQRSKYRNFLCVLLSKCPLYSSGLCSQCAC